MPAEQGMIDDAQAGGLSILETARVRWLNVEEIITLLSTPGAIPMGTAPPATPPPSGTLLLFDRSVVRNYKVDGHEWIKKRNNPNKVREDHVKLRYKGQYRVAGTYVHSVRASTMHRRAYRLIADPASSRPAAKVGGDVPPAENTEIVVVHYLDTLEAARVSALYADHLAASASGDSRNVSVARSSAAAAVGGDYSGAGQGGVGFPQQIQVQQRQRQRQQQQQQGYGGDHAAQYGYQLQAQKRGQDVDECGTAFQGTVTDHDRVESLDEEALDILWEMVLEEGGEDLEQEIQEAAASAIEEHVPPRLEAQLVNTVEEAIQNVIATSTLSGHLTAVSEDDIRDVIDSILNEKSGSDNSTLADIESKVVEVVEENLPDDLQDKLVESMKTKLEEESRGESSRIMGDVEDDEMDDTPEMPPLPSFAEYVAEEVPKPVNQLEKVPQTPLPEIIDFTPEEAFPRSPKPVKVVISTSSPIPILPPDDPPYRWHVIAAFVDIGKSAERLNNSDPNGGVDPSQDGSPFSPDPLIMKVALAEVTKITPYSYKCYLPNDISKPGKRAIILTGIRYIDDEADLLWDPVRVAVKVCIQAEWNVASDMTNACSKARLQGSDLIRPKFFAPAGSGNVQLLSQLSQEQFEFLGVPAVNALPAELTGTDSIRMLRDSITSEKSASALPAPAPAMATVASALTQLEYNPPPKALGEDIPASNSRKRALTLDDVHTEDLVQDANESAANWVTSVVPNSDGMTKGMVVDRYCKIRFVERLANVIVGTEDSGVVDASAAKSTDITGAGSPDTGSNYPDLLLNLEGDAKLRDIGDEELDSLLHSVLIRFVESMVDSSTSEDELKEALNKPGLSGFTLLHYAALYNILSLVPLLLSRGADPNVSTQKGNLTPLHLAAGAGHDQIVDALVRNGCRIAPMDSFGLSPADHALRNGFNEISEWLVDKCRSQNIGSGEESPQKPQGINMATKWTLDSQNEKGDMMQSAFKELSLKDKLGLNLFVQRYKHGESNIGGDGSSQSAMHDIDEDNASAGALDFTFISEKDRESLKTAMSMMSKDELDELEKHAPYSNVREWMVRSNYESLRDASLQLEKQAKRRALSAGKKQSYSQSGGGSQSAGSKKFAYSKLSQVLAMLVLRKNLMGASESNSQGHGQEQEGGQKQGSSNMETS